MKSSNELLVKARQNVIDAGRLYYAEHAKQQTTFVAGKSYIPVTAKDLDSNDLVALLESSLVVS